MAGIAQFFGCGCSPIRHDAISPTCQPRSSTSEKRLPQKSEKEICASSIPQMQSIHSRKSGRIGSLSQNEKIDIRHKDASSSSIAGGHGSGSLDAVETKKSTQSSSSNHSQHQQHSSDLRKRPSRLGRSNSSDANLYQNITIRRPSLNQEVLLANFGPVRKSSRQDSSSVGIVVWTQQNAGEPGYTNGSSSVQLKPTTVTTGEGSGGSSTSVTSPLPESITVTTESERDIAAHCPVKLHCPETEEESRAIEPMDPPKLIVSRSRRSSISMVELQVVGSLQNDPLTRFNTLKPRLKPQDELPESHSSSLQAVDKSNFPTSVPSIVTPESNSSHSHQELGVSCDVNPSTVSLGVGQGFTTTSTDSSQSHSQVHISETKRGSLHGKPPPHRLPHLVSRSTQQLGVTINDGLARTSHGSMKPDGIHMSATFPEPRATSIKRVYLSSDVNGSSVFQTEEGSQDAIRSRKDQSSQMHSSPTSPNGGNRFLWSLFSQSTTSPTTNDSMYIPVTKTSAQHYDTRSRRSSHDTDAHMKRGVERKKRLEASNKKLTRELEDLKFQQLLATIPKVNSFYELDK